MIDSAGDHWSCRQIGECFIYIFGLYHLHIKISEIGVVEINADNSEGKHLFAICVEGEGGTLWLERFLGIELPGYFRLAYSVDGMAGEEDQEDRHHYQRYNSA